MDTTLIAIAFFLLIAIVFLLLFLFKSINKKSFKADDGSVFANEEDLDLYNELYTRTSSLFLDEDTQNESKDLLGFEKPFLNRLKNDGFTDLKTLIKFRKQFELLSNLINPN